MDPTVKQLRELLDSRDNDHMQPITESFTISRHEFNLARIACTLTDNHHARAGYLRWRLQCSEERADQILAVAQRHLG
jgi:hypothetical protein